MKVEDTQSNWPIPHSISPIVELELTHPLLRQHF